MAMRSPRAAQVFVPVVESEENLAHVATMAGMASSDVGRSDLGRTPRGQIGNQLLHELSIGRQAS